eukprot:284552-Prorocentrum_minimum.AAC.1
MALYESLYAVILAFLLALYRALWTLRSCCLAVCFLAPCPAKGGGNAPSSGGFFVDHHCRRVRYSTLDAVAASTGTHRLPVTKNCIDSASDCSQRPPQHFLSSARGGRQKPETPSRPKRVSHSVTRPKRRRRFFRSLSVARPLAARAATPLGRLGISHSVTQYHFWSLACSAARTAATSLGLLRISISS